MYGDVIHSTEALIITLFSMGMVFLVLLFLSFILDIFKLGNKRKKATLIKKTEVPVKYEIKKEEVDDSELIAVIAAAIAMQTGQNPESIRIKRVQAVGNQTPAWTKAAIQDHMLSQL